jgi:hypothetical protein
MAAYSFSTASLCLVMYASTASNCSSEMPMACLTASLLHSALQVVHHREDRHPGSSDAWPPSGLDDQWRFSWGSSQRPPPESLALSHYITGELPASQPGRRGMAHALLRHGVHAYFFSASSNHAFAAWRSAVSKLSVHHPQISTKRPRAAVRLHMPIR